MCCSKSIKLNGFIDSFSIVKENKEDINNFEDPNNRSVTSEVINVTLQENEAPKEVVFQNTESQLNSNAVKKSPENSTKLGNTKNTTTEKANYEKVILKGDPVSLLCLNINYYMGGTKNIWNKSEKNFGLEYKHRLKNILNENDLVVI